MNDISKTRSLIFLLKTALASPTEDQAEMICQRCREVYGSFIQGIAWADEAESKEFYKEIPEVIGLIERGQEILSNHSHKHSDLYLNSISDKKDMLSKIHKSSSLEPLSCVAK